MRGQVSLEIFFSVSLFVLLLFWLNHFVAVAAEASASSRPTSVAAFSLARVADAACRLNASVNVPAPCLPEDGSVVVVADGGVVFLNGDAAPTACRFQSGQRLVLACGDRLCVSAQGVGGARLFPADCPEA